MTATSITCPLCSEALDLSSTPRKVLQCQAGHRFDAAKQGYFNFLTGKGTNFIEDTGPMVQAREAFQERGYYTPLAEHIAQTVSQHHQRENLDILDAGAGTGYYLGKILQSVPAETCDALAIDISRYAMRRAAKLPNTTAVVWDVWRQLPTADHSRDIVLNCFAPHNPAEFHRVLRSDGLCVVVTGASDHLLEVREELGMLTVGADKQKSLVEKFAAHGLAHLSSRNLNYEMQLSSEDLYNLAFMGPAGHHLSPDSLREKSETLGIQRVNASFDVHLFAPLA